MMGTTSFLTSQGETIPSPATGFALIDTGATRSCVDSRIISDLGVNPIGVVSLGTANGLSQHNLYPAKFRFPVTKFDIEFSSVVGVDLMGQSIGKLQMIALIGRDVLSHCLLVYNGAQGNFSLAL